jgi:RNA polymerase sigma factor (sigma-70 family)
VNNKNLINLEKIDSKHLSSEVLMPIELIEQIFDVSKKLGYETQEERDYREQKEDYNNKLIQKIMDVNFTEKQRYVMTAIFFRNLTLGQIAKEMGVALGTVQVIKRQMLTKIRKRIKYNFNYVDEQS